MSIPEGFHPGMGATGGPKLSAGLPYHRPANGSAQGLHVPHPLGEGGGGDAKPSLFNPGTRPAIQPE